MLRPASPEAYSRQAVKMLYSWQYLIKARCPTAFWVRSVDLLYHSAHDSELHVNPAGHGRHIVGTMYALTTQQEALRVSMLRCHLTDLQCQ